MALAKETKARGWWLSYSDVINDGFDVYIGLEEAAARFSWYEAELVPGLFQTADYARTLIAADNPGLDEAEVDRRVQLRLARQTLLTRVTAPPRVDVVLNEAILRRPIGGRTVMAAQLDRLLEFDDLANVSIKVVRFDAGLHHGVMSAPFVLLEFPVNGNGSASEPPTVYVDGFTGALFLDKPDEIASYSGAFEALWQTASGDRELIADAAKELRE